MAVYYKPQSPIQSGEDFIYPITTADQIMKSDNSRRLEQAGLIVADNSTSLGGVAAEDYALKTDTAADSAKLGGKAPEYYLQPMNLLDNSDFKNPVNQRGAVYGANRNSGYTIDRWYYEQSAGAGDGYFGLTEFYVSLLAPSDGYSQMYQNLEKYAKLKGENVTFAARVSRGSTDKIVCVTFTLGSIDVGLNLFEDGNLKLYSVDGMNILIRATGAEEFQFIWASLYKGTYTADTLPPYVPKGYAAELAACNAAPVDLGGGYGGGSLQAYPVGSIYMSVNSTSPASLFGGTWEQIKGRFLLGCGDNGDGWNYTPNSTGGNPAVTLTENEMPSHTHALYGYVYNWGSFISNVVHIHNSTAEFGTVDGNRLYTNQGAWDVTQSRGGNGAHNNMPPYLAVYMWERVR